MKKLALVLLVVGLSVPAFAAVPGTDNAADPAYGSGWTNGTNGGTTGTFDAWDLTNNNNDNTTNFAGYFLGDSTAGAGNINTGGQSFGVYANPGTAYANASRNFGTPLFLGQTFSIDISVSFRNGNKGFSLEDNTGGGQIFNFNVGSDDYQVNGTSLGLSYDSTAVFSLSFTQTTLTAGTWTILLDGNSFTNNTGTYTGLATGFNLYNSGTDNNNPANNLYFNNLAISAIPEPSSLALLGGPILLGAYLFVRRRR